MSTKKEKKIPLVKRRLEESLMFWVNGIGELDDRLRKLEDAPARNEDQPFGELYVDYDGQVHFICHTRGTDFAATREVIGKFVKLLQDKIDRGDECPYNNEESTVRICKKYGVNGRGRVYNLQSGNEIPRDEPLFVFRAQDRHLPELLSVYAGMCRGEAHAFVVLDRKAEVDSWQSKNRERIKEPDTDLSDYDSGPFEYESEEQFQSRKTAALRRMVDEAADKKEPGFSPQMYARGILRMSGEDPDRAVGPLDDDKSTLREKPKPEWDITVYGPDVSKRHVRVLETKVDEAGYLHIFMVDGKRSFYNRTEWSCVEKEPRHAEEE